MTTRDVTYWNAKFEAYVHDPFDKVFCIPGHESRAEKIRAAFGLHGEIAAPHWKEADCFASGLQRGQVPTYDQDEHKDGSIDYLKNPVLTHCISEHPQLRVELPPGGTENASYAAEINNAMVDYLNKRIGDEARGGGISNQPCYKNKPEIFAKARFLYTHLLLRNDLANSDIGGLGALWHRIPADSRFPDHSIWQHAALTSAYGSCLDLAEGGPAGLMVFSITPVQAFIAKARKLRDFWTGSMLLSWLAFEGIRWVMENLGPDHVIYPSLIDQPLVLRYLKQEWDLSPDTSNTSPNGGPISLNDSIASFPNKFVLLVPMCEAKEIAQKVSAAIREKWMALSKSTHELVAATLKGSLDEASAKYLEDIFQRQNENFWDIQWATSSLVEKDDKATVAGLLPKDVYEAPYAVLDCFNAMIKGKGFDTSGTGTLYAVSHALCQSALAATKAYRPITRNAEPGQKCHLCGEFEVLHLPYQQGESARKYKEECVGAFWDTLRAVWRPDTDFRKNEALCSVCLMKRLAYKVIGKDTKHALYHAFQFKDDKSFPSTTELALTQYWEGLTPEIRDALQQQNIEKADLAQYFHQADAEMPDQENAGEDPGRDRKLEELFKKKRPSDKDRYYAILVMDGDKMGELVSGKNITATWGSAMHAEIVKRMQTAGFDPAYRDNWQKLFDKDDQNLIKKRLLTSDTHAAISEALGDFALHGVSRIINKEFQGKLIYAGGDDVCAVLPVSTALEAARQIREYYRAGFKFVDPDGVAEDIKDNFACKPGKLCIHMGKACTISAGILICHHKEPLSGMIRQAEDLLNTYAKKQCGRDACAIELRKRSGGSRYFMARWDDMNEFNQENIWDSFQKLWEDKAMPTEPGIGKSLLYRFASLKDGFQTVIDGPENDFTERTRKLVAFQAKRTLGISAEKDAEKLARVSDRLAGLIFERTGDGKPCFRPERLIVSEFLWPREDNQ